MRLPRVVLWVFACLLSAAPSHAGLIDLGNGMIYDTMQDLTWLRDMRYAWTSAADTDGGMPYANAVAWVDALHFGGYDDWRLPRAFLPRRGGRPPVWVAPWSETSVVMQQLGWRWIVDDIGNRWYEQGTVGPFVNFDAPGASLQFWTSSIEVWNAWFDWDIPDHGSSNGTVGAWAVRDGRARVPEPSTLLLIGLGAGIICWRERHHLKRG